MLAIKSEPIPLTVDDDGIVRVSNSRITLDNIIISFKSGATAEVIASQYPSLHLADIYAVISYYLRAQDDVEAYLAQRETARAKVRQQNEMRFDPEGIRDRLLARQNQTER